MTHDKELIERMKAAIEGECDGLAIDDTHAKAILDYVLGDYLAERWGEAVAYRHTSEIGSCLNTLPDQLAGWVTEPLFLAPQPAIPEGWLPDGDNQIPSHISKAGADRLGQLGISVSFYEIDEALRAMLAAIGVKP